MSHNDIDERLRSQDAISLCIIIAVNIIASYAAYIAAPSEATMKDVYRIFYIHTPTAWICYLALTISLVASMLFLLKRRNAYDRIAEASAALGLIYGLIAIVTGSIWSNAVWGAYWNWDPRQTTTLILWMAYMGYLSLRLSIENVEKRMLIGAVYDVLAFMTIPLSYMSITFWQSLHPRIISPTEFSLTIPMIETLLMNLIAVSLIFAYLLRSMLEVGSLEDRLESMALKRGGGEFGT